LRREEQRKRERRRDESEEREERGKKKKGCVDDVPTVDGWASDLFSDVSAAAVQCAIMKPEFNPP
jgi:hypothetical protein